MEPQTPPLHPENKPTSADIRALPLSTECNDTSFERKWLIRILLAILGLALIISTACWYLSRTSLPGTRFYPVKTRIVEKALGLFAFSDSARASYDIQLLEQRLAELQTLATDDATTTPETLAIVAGLIDAHTSDASRTIADSSQSSEEKIILLARLSAITRAQEILISDTGEFETAKDAIDATRARVSTSLRSAVEGYAGSSNPEAVRAFLGAQIATVAERIGEVAQGSRAQRLAIQRISDANESVADGKLADALLSILKAQEAIEVDGHLFDSERGPQDGAPIEPVAIPEGN